MLAVIFVSNVCHIYILVTKQRWSKHHHLFIIQWIHQVLKITVSILRKKEEDLLLLKFSDLHTTCAKHFSHSTLFRCSSLFLYYSLLLLSLSVSVCLSVFLSVCLSLSLSLSIYIYILVLIRKLKRYIGCTICHPQLGGKTWGGHKTFCLSLWGFVVVTGILLRLLEFCWSHCMEFCCSNLRVGLESLMFCWSDRFCWSDCDAWEHTYSKCVALLCPGCFPWGVWISVECCLLLLLLQGYEPNPLLGASLEVWTIPVVCYCCRGMNQTRWLVHL